MQLVDPDDARWLQASKSYGKVRSWFRRLLKTVYPVNHQGGELAERQVVMRCQFGSNDSPPTFGGSGSQSDLEGSMKRSWLNNSQCLWF